MIFVNHVALASIWHTEEQERYVTSSDGLTRRGSEVLVRGDKFFLVVANILGMKLVPDPAISSN